MVNQEYLPLIIKCGYHCMPRSIIQALPQLILYNHSFEISEIQSALFKFPEDIYYSCTQSFKKNVAIANDRQSNCLIRVNNRELVATRNVIDKSSRTMTHSARFTLYS